MLGKLISKYRRKGVLVDTNLLVGFLVGTLGKEHLKNCRATKVFTPEDFDLLDSFLRNFRKVVTTPHILTETSNLAGRLPENLHAPFRLIFRRIVEGVEERFEPSKDLCGREEFLRLGLADTAISATAPGQFLVLTDEFALYGSLQKRGVDAVNFNHLRQYSW